MKPERALLGLAALLLGNAAAPIPPLTPAELAFARTEGAYHSYRQQPLAAWEEDLAQALAGAGPDQTADRLAPRYGLTSADMRNLVRLWLTVRARHYGLECAASCSPCSPRPGGRHSPSRWWRRASTPWPIAPARISPR
jgi:hypothetical protein